MKTEDYIGKLKFSKLYLLYKKNKLKWDPKNWQKNIDEIFGDLVNKYKDELENYNSPEYYFCLDFLLWKKN